jgi:hypothetical protein
MSRKQLLGGCIALATGAIISALNAKDPMSARASES